MSSQTANPDRTDTLRILGPTTVWWHCMRELTRFVGWKNFKLMGLTNRNGRWLGGSALRLEVFPTVLTDKPDATLSFTHRGYRIACV